MKIHFDDSKLHHVAAKCGVFAETDIVNLVKSGIPATEILCSLADAIVLQNLSRADARQHAASTRCCCSAARTPTCPSCRSAGACASPRPGTSAATTTRRTCPSKSSIFVPENAQYYAAFGAVRLRPARGRPRSAATAASTGSDDYMTNGRKARLGETRRPAAREDGAGAQRLPTSSTRSRSSSRRSSSPGRSCAASSASTAARPRRKAVLVDEEGEILCKAYQLSKGNPIQDTKEILAAAQGATSTTRARRSRCIGFGAHRLRGRRARGVRARPT